MLKTVVLLALVALSVYAARHEDLPEEHRKLTGQALVDHINKQGKWEATTYDRFEGKSVEELRKYLGAIKKPGHARRRGVPGKKTGRLDKVPDSFDSVQNWPQCASIVGLIQDQSACGSCWAVSTSSALSDRLCIASDGKIQKSLSALDLMACCSYCGYQCQGGWPDEAFYYFSKKGIVTGSNYTSDGGCKPYPIPPCTQDKQGKMHCPDEPDEDYKCAKSCNSGYTEETYDKDHYFGKDDVLYFSNDNDAAIEELVKNGPIVAAFDVYEDFYKYKGGIYEHTGGSFVGGHAVRIVGYGVENGIPYWKVANSWDWFWGEEGYFRIRRGTDECGFEDEITTIAGDVARSLKDK